MTCEEFQLSLTDYLEGALAAERRLCFAEHLDRCPECSRYLRETQAVIVALSRLEPSQAPDALRESALTAFQQRWPAQDAHAQRTARARWVLDPLETLLRRYATWRLLGLALLVSLLLSLTFGPGTEIDRPGLPRICLLVEVVAGLAPASGLLVACWWERRRISLHAFALVAASGALAGQLLLFALCPMRDARVHALVIHSAGIVAAIVSGTLLGQLQLGLRRL